MYQFGIGFKSTVQAKEDIEKEKERKTIVELSSELYIL
jgi:hypothetical protein